MIHGRRPHAPCRGAACRSRRCTNDWNNVPLKRHAPIASVAALSERHAHPRITERPRRPHAPCRGRACPSRRCTGVISGPSIKRGWPPPICHCEEAAGRRGALSAKREEVPLGCNLGEAVAISPMAFLLSGRVLRDCHVASLLAMTRQGGTAMGTVRRTELAVLLPLRGRAGHAPPLQGQCGFNGGRCESAVPSRDCHVASLLAMTRQGSAVVRR